MVKDIKFVYELKLALHSGTDKELYTLVERFRKEGFEVHGAIVRCVVDE